MERRSGTTRHAFLSYGREDAARVDELQEMLEASGVPVWRDTADLWPGQDWQAKIREAIQADSLAFVACFSAALEERETSYQNEELVLAVDQYRLRRPDRSWLFTVRFDECTIPSYNLGAGQTLDRTIQYADLFGTRKSVQMIRLSQAISSIVNPTSTTTPSTAVAAARAAQGDARVKADTMKQLLRDPNADIVLEDFMRDLARPIAAALNDDDQFPTTTSDGTVPGVYEAWITQLDGYEAAVSPTLNAVRLAAAYGRPEHNPAWSRFMTLVASGVSRREGAPFLLEFRGYPAVLLMYVAAIAATVRGNYTPLPAFLVEPRVRERLNPDRSLPLVAYTGSRAVVTPLGTIASAVARRDEGQGIDQDLLFALHNQTVSTRHTPISDHIHTLLRDLFSEEFASSDEYDEAFDRAEVLMDALSADWYLQTGRWSIPKDGYGRYTYRYEYSDTPVEQGMLAQARAQRDSWRPVLAGLFGGNPDRAIAALENVAQTVERVRHRLL